MPDPGIWFPLASDIGVGFSWRMHGNWAFLTKLLLNTAPVAPLSNNKRACSLCFSPLWLYSSLTFMCIDLVWSGRLASLSRLVGLLLLNILLVSVWCVVLFSTGLVLNFSCLSTQERPPWVVSNYNLNFKYGVSSSLGVYYHASMISGIQPSSGKLAK